MKVEDELFFLEKVNDGFEGVPTVEIPVIKEGEAHIKLRVNDDLYQINLTQGFFEDK